MSLTIKSGEPAYAESLQDKTCVITGSSRGIGKLIALELASHGADIAVNYRSSGTAAASVVDEIDDFGSDAIAVKADVSAFDETAEMADVIRNHLGPVDVLVNNAGVTADARFENMTFEDWSRVIDVNLGGAFNCTKAFFHDIRAAEEGRVINVSSVVGQQGNYGQANYAASKSGLFGLTRTLALELADSGSTANCIAPGFTETDMLAVVPERVRENILRRIPLDRFAKPEDIIGMVRLVASDESSYMTGQVIGINGGMAW